MQYGRSVRLQRQLQLNVRPTIHEVFPGNVSSGKMTIRETSFRESNHPGNDRIPVYALNCIACLHMHCIFI